MTNRRAVFGLVLAALVLALMWWARADTEQERSSAGDDADSGLPVVELASLPPEAAETVDLIDSGGPFPYPEKDGSRFGNFEGLLPDQADGYYREYTVPTPGSDDRGARRIVAGERRRALLDRATTTAASRGSPDERTGGTPGRAHPGGHLHAGTAPSRPPTCSTRSSTPAGASRHLDGVGTESKSEFLEGIGQALCFPDYYGQNFDALADLLSDVDGGDQDGVVLLWEGWGPFARADERAFSVALSVLGTRVNAERGGPFSVLLRGEGPDVPGIASLD